MIIIIILKNIYIYISLLQLSKLKIIMDFHFIIIKLLNFIYQIK